MRLIGLTGGIATGKSTLTAELRSLGAAIIDADHLARQVVQCGTPTLNEIVRVFGPEVLTAQGELDRKRMATRVFQDPVERARLESIIHPAIRQAMLERTHQLAAAGHDLIFYEAPLLYEVGIDQLADCVVLVHARRETQERRLAERDRLSPEEIGARLAAQLPIEEKIARADVLVDGEGDLATLPARAAALLADLRAGLGRRLPNGKPARY